MNESVHDCLTKAIETECLAAELYTLFHRTLPEDKNFWWQLVIEEKNHAALLRSGKELFLDRDKFPLEFLAPDEETYTGVNSRLRACLDRFGQNPPCRETAFNLALQLENSAGELHFQNAVENQNPSAALKIFQNLNRDDRDHALRIRSYMQDYQILVCPDPLL